ncbi:MAG: hypothetical protein HY854_07365 [Burkholderiales bacterium]|nr:hypothetical protein [Burkholderiales bacterium]
MSLKRVAVFALAALGAAAVQAQDGQKVEWFDPPAGLVKENQDYLLRMAPGMPAREAAGELRCVVDGRTQAARILPDARAHELYADAYRHRIGASAQPFAASSWLAVSCGSDLVQGTRVRLTWAGAPVAGEFQVRGPFEASVQCTALGTQGACDPRQPVRVAFNADVPAEQLRAVQAQVAPGVDLPLHASIWNGQGRNAWTLLPPLGPAIPEGATVAFTLPERMADADGRPLANAGDFPRRVRIAELPMYVGFPEARGVLPLAARGGAVWPLAGRRTGAQVTVRALRIDAAARLPAAQLLSLWRGQDRWPSAAERTEWTVPGSAGGMAFLPVRIDRAGLYRLEAEGSRQQRTSVVLVTNLHIATRLAAAGDSVVWVTSIDSGRPVAGAAVEVVACDGAVLARGETDASGLLRTGQALRGARPACQQPQVAVVARKDGDFAILAEEGGTTAAKPDIIVHTIVDRVLLKPGETLHMQHVARRTTQQGLAAPPAGPGRLDVFHGSEKVASLPVDWDASGHAHSQWRLPEQAKTGGYRATVTSPGGAATASLAFAVGEARPRAADATAPVQLKLDASGASASAGRAAVEVEGGRLRLRSPFVPASALVTVERAGVRHASVHTLTTPESTLALPALQALADAQVRVLFVRGAEGAGPLAVERSVDVGAGPAASALEVEVAPASATVAPRSTVAVRIRARTAEGRAGAAGARLVVAAVDESLLARGANRSWQVLEAMTRQSQGLVHGQALHSQLVRTVRLGAQPSFLPPDEAPRASPAQQAAQPDGIDEPDLPAAAAGASTLALWKTDAVLDANGEATVEVPLAASVTRWRIVAIAMQGASRFGTGEATVQAWQPVQVIATLPAVVRTGDRILQQAAVRNNSGAAVQLRLRATARTEGAESIQLDRAVTLAAGATQAVSWDYLVPTGAATVHWRLLATTADSRTADSASFDQQVQPAHVQRVQHVALLPVEGRDPVPVEIPARADAGPASVTVTLQPGVAGAALAEARRWMAEYPHRGLEQRASIAAALDDRQRWAALMEELPAYLDAQGLARHFADVRHPGSETLTAYLLDLASARGWPVPEPLRARMAQGLLHVLDGTEAPRDWAPADIATITRQLALQATLAELGALQDRTRLAVRPEDPGKLPTAAIIDWVRGLLALPEPARFAQDVRRAALVLRERFDVQGPQLRWRTEMDEGGWWFMSSGDVTAARLALLLQKWQATDSDWQADVPLVVRGLIGRQLGGRWSTTNANAWAAIALERFASEREAAAVSGRTRVTLGPPSGPGLVANWPQPGRLVLPLAASSPASRLEIIHEGNGRPWAMVAVRSAPPLERATEAGFRIDKELVPLQQQVAGRWSPGDTVLVRLAVHASAAMAWVALQDPLPPGAAVVGRPGSREPAMEPVFVESAPGSLRAYWRWVPAGSWTLEYTARLDSTGTFHLPPTRAEALYAPAMFGEWPNPVLRVGAP